MYIYIYIYGSQCDCKSHPCGFVLLGEFSLLRSHVYGLVIERMLVSNRIAIWHGPSRISAALAARIREYRSFN